MKIGCKEFDVKNHTYIMGILNVTPDSFSDGGKWNNKDKALSHVETMLNEGADIIDVGGESTRPGHTQVSTEEEIERVVPIIDEIKKRFQVPISVDTYKSEVAIEALKVGADLINDIWGLKYDSKMGKIIAESGVACCLMHNRNDTNYKDFMKDYLMDIEEILDIAKTSGISKDKIILDPGVGFGKTQEQNLEVIARLQALNDFGYPVLLGTSRKSVIGRVLDLPSDERIEGTITTTVMAVMQNCAFVRVHDIKENYRAIKMAEAIKNSIR